MGQHQIQRQILQNFSFEGRQPNSRQVWYLNTDSYQPAARSVYHVGFFEVDCSEDVDEYIRALENRFKDSLHRFSRGEFTRTDVGRDIYDFIAMHYVRSQACRRQIAHVVRECQRQSRITRSQSDAEYKRLTSYQDVSVFRYLVDSVSRVLTHYVLYPLLLTGPWAFVTSDKIIYASTLESDQRETFVWFPISKSTGFSVLSDGRAGQILGPEVVVNRLTGQLDFAKFPEALFLRCQAPSPQEGSAEFVNTVNGMMVQGSTQICAAERFAIDSALRTAELPTGYRYQPAAAGGT